MAKPAIFLMIIYLTQTLVNGTQTGIPKISTGSLFGLWGVGISEVVGATGVRPGLFGFITVV